MALIVALLAWRWPARTIRAQVLTMRERAWVQVARLSGMSGLKIIFLELMPNLLPYLAAALVGAVASAILASIGLEALGLGPADSPTLGMTIYWVIYYAALLHGYWWWWLPPIAMITILFVGLFSLASGLDEIANPRLRKQPGLVSSRAFAARVPGGGEAPWPETSGRRRELIEHQLPGQVPRRLIDVRVVVRWPTRPFSVLKAML